MKDLEWREDSLDIVGVVQEVASESVANCIVRR